MHQTSKLALIAMLSAVPGGCSGGNSPVPGTPPDPGPLAGASDEFDEATTVTNWSRVFMAELWGFDQLESFDVHGTRPGWMTMIPYASTWFREYRGVLAFKSVAGDFVVTTSLEVTNRAGTGPPGRTFSLAGIMVRAPRNITPATWTPNGEHYVFLSLGAANAANTYQTEVKTTLNSDSTLVIDPAPGGMAIIRVPRLGPHIITLIRFPGGTWQVHRRYLRADFPNELQVGLTAYTDWDTASAWTAAQHNATLITGGSPDLTVHFDYVRYVSPQVPAALVGADFSNPTGVSDAALLSFLGFD